MCRVILATLIGVVLAGQSFAQIGVDSNYKVHRTRISALAGLPRIAGFQGEYVPNAFNNHLGLKVDVSVLPNLYPESKTNTRYTGIGLNAYANQNGTGPYLGMSYGHLFITADEIDNDPVDIDVSFKWLTSQVGVKAGKRFFFRFELGYSLIFFDVDKANEFLNETYGVEVKPTINFLHFPNASIGIGYAF